jgi:peptidoglycan/LPS O-acetylase OafA/YrhL
LLGSPAEVRRLKSRIPQLDILRAVAILLVLGRHCVVPPEQAGHLAVIAGFWQRFGWTGVDLFFVLSGFLVGGLLYRELLETERLDVGRFLVRRGFKIWPSYYVFVLYLLVSSYAETPERGLGCVIDLVPHLFHVQNYFGPIRLPTWSLAIEEHFYLAFPLLLFLTSRRGRPRATLVLLATLAALATCTTLRVLGHPTPPIDFPTYLAPTHLRLDGLVFGTALAYVYHSSPTRFRSLARYRLPILALGIFLVSPMLFLDLAESPFVSTWGFSLLYIGYGCVIVAAMTLDENSPRVRAVVSSLPSRALLLVGASSYSIYLWHWHFARSPFLSLAKGPTIATWPPTLRWLAFMAAYVGAAVLVGYVAGRLVEMPALALRDRLFPSRIPGPATSVGIAEGRPDPV